jgi:NAD(P)H-dependent FMN reductase
MDRDRQFADHDTAPGTEADVLTVAVLVGSTRAGRVGLPVAEWFAALARERPGFAVDFVDLATFDFPAVHPAQPTPQTARFTAHVASADAFVVVTPEYNHGYPASLKQAIDLPYEEWRAKPVGFVSYGGVAQGLRAVEQLRQVFAELHAVTLRDGVSLNIYDGGLGDDGRPPADGAAEQAAGVLLDHLAWWGHTLREGRRTRPYAT